MKEFERRSEGFATDENENLKIAISADGSAAGAEVEREPERLKLLISNLRDHAVIEIDENHLICGWNYGAQQMLGWNEQEIAGQPAGIFFTPEDVQSGEPGNEFAAAMRDQSIEEERWHARKDGSRFWVAVRSA